MKLTDVLAKVLKKNNVSGVFGLQGGAVVHIFDSFEKFNLNVTYMHHEQSASYAAVSCAKSSEKISCVVVTTGPGATNAITGLLSAWQDSVPVIFISGQARSSHLSYGKKVRQVGTQEVNICDIVKPIAKECFVISNKNNFQKTLEYAILISKSGRPGPVWVDLPLEFQWANIKYKKNLILNKKKEFKKKIHFQKFYNLIKDSKKPLFVVGFGSRLSKDAGKKIYRLSKTKNIPLVTTWNACDLFETSFNNNLGIIGMSGQRGANKAIFNSDLLICLGTHLSIPHTTTLYEKYAPNAKKIIVNIDDDQLKNLNVKFDLKINSDVSFFVKRLNKNKIKNYNWHNKNKFKSLNWYYPIKTSKPNSNIFIRELCKKMRNKFCLTIDGGGTALYAGFQSSIIKRNCRIICSSAISAMGTGLAETVGVFKSLKFKNIVTIIGDGSFLMNVQDLQSIKQDKIPAKIIVVNNNGYLAIRDTQKEFLNSKFYGTHPKWGLTIPSIKKIARAFDINYISVKSSTSVDSITSLLAKKKKTIICELFVDENQPSLFKQGYKRASNGIFIPQALDDMFPFLDQSIANTNN